jgi:arabinose-5-phosphate isomerase
MNGSVATGGRDGARAKTASADEVLRIGRDVLAREAEAVACANARLGESFVRAVDLIRRCSGRIAVTGMGKGGIVGRKIQATLASTGTPAYALHPAEAIHGDLGMICPEDVVLVLSNSGETQELVKLLPVFQRIGCRVILLTGRPQSRCGKLADVVIDIGDTPEACPLGLAPSSSTTAMMAAGDALALTVMKLNDVQRDQYAAFHPGGSLGRGLMRVREIMRTGPDCPTLPPEATVAEYYDVLLKAPRRAGAASVVGTDGRLVGVFTHGDFVRCFQQERRPLDVRMADVMTTNPKFAQADDRVPDALHTMQTYRIDELPVVDGDHQLVGMIDIQDLIAYGYSAFDDQ